MKNAITGVRLLHEREREVMEGGGRLEPRGGGGNRGEEEGVQRALGEGDTNHEGDSVGVDSADGVATSGVAHLSGRELHDGLGLSDGEVHVLVLHLVRVVIPLLGRGLRGQG